MSQQGPGNRGSRGAPDPSSEFTEPVTIPKSLRKSQKPAAPAGPNPFDDLPEEKSAVRRLYDNLFGDMTKVVRMPMGLSKPRPAPPAGPLDPPTAPLKTGSNKNRTAAAPPKAGRRTGWLWFLFLLAVGAGGALWAWANGALSIPWLDQAPPLTAPAAPKLEEPKSPNPQSSPAPVATPTTTAPAAASTPRPASSQATPAPSSTRKPAASAASRSHVKAKKKKRRHPKRS